MDDFDPLAALASASYAIDHTSLPVLGTDYRQQDFDPTNTPPSDTPNVAEHPEAVHLAATLLTRLRQQRLQRANSFGSVGSHHSLQLPLYTPLASKPHSIGSHSSSEGSLHELGGDHVITATNNLAQSTHAMLTLQLRIVSMISRGDLVNAE
jgi:hypothetical protein